MQYTDFYKELTNESPLGSFQTIGDFDEPKSFRDSRDRSSVVNPSTVKKLQNILKNSSVDFDLYFVNKPGLRKFLEHGNVNYKFLVTAYPNGLGLSPDDFKPINSDNITVFFVGNTAAQKIPMTAWTIAHRIGHAMRRTPMFQEYFKNVEKDFNVLLEYYKITPPPHSYNDVYYYKKARKFDLAKGRLFNTIGTMKSAREEKVHLRHFEFYYELFVQYLKDGEIKFNPLPKDLLVGFGPYGSKILAQTQQLEEAQEALNNIANTIPYYINDVLTANIGEIFVM